MSPLISRDILGQTSIFQFQLKALPLQPEFNKKIVMANPIKETPVLYGEDARQFAERISSPQPLSKEEIEDLKQMYEIHKQSLERGRQLKEAGLLW